MLVGGITPSERGINVTLLAYSNALGNSIPPVLILPREYFKIRMLDNAPSGTHETSHPCSWSNLEKFIEFLDNFIHHVKPTKKRKSSSSWAIISHVLIATKTKT
jgi:hypothetical protein